MRLDFDPAVDAWCLTLSDRPVNRTVHVSHDVAVDVDVADAVVAVEFLLAPAVIEPSVRETLFERFPVVRTALAQFQAAVA